MIDRVDELTPTERIRDAEKRGEIDFKAITDKLFDALFDRTYKWDKNKIETTLREVAEAARKEERIIACKVLCEGCNLGKPMKPDWLHDLPSNPECHAMMLRMAFQLYDDADFAPAEEVK